MESIIAPDDALNALVADDILYSLDEISPDVVCDEQTESLFQSNSAKDIINGTSIFVRNSLIMCACERTILKL